MTKKHIVAMGGGGFTANKGVSSIEKYCLKLTNKKYPKVCFIGTASGDDRMYIDGFYKAFSKVDCYLSHLDLFGSNHTNNEEYLLDQDLIYVGGGNTFNMMLIWKARGIDKILKRAWDKGIVLVGGSAGSLCWFESGNTDSFGQLAKVECLGFLPYSHSPHYDGEKNRRPNYHELILSKEIKPGYAMDNYTAVHFEGEKPFKVISEKLESKVYWVDVKYDKIVETVLEAELLRA